jgi:flagellar motor switch protein FliG
MSDTPTRIVGYGNRLGTESKVEAWKPFSRDQVAALPPLASPPQRGWKVAEPDKTQPPSPQAPTPSSQPLRLPADLPTDSIEALVATRPHEAAGVLRALLISEEESDLEKAAIVCIGLGQDLAGEAMKHLSDAEIETLTGCIGQLHNISAKIRKDSLEEFRQHMLDGEWVSNGGVDFCRSALERAVGPQKARELVERLGNSSGFHMLRNANADQVAPFIANEHPQTIALILSQLDPAQAAGILGYLPEVLQVDVIQRITTMDNVSQTVLKHIEESLEQSLRNVLGGDANVGGPKVAADILNFAGSGIERDVLKALDKTDAGQAESIRNLMFVFADIAQLSDKEIQLVMKEVDQKDLVVALKATNEQVLQKFLSNASEKVGKFLIEEIEFLGPMRLSEVEEVQLRIVHIVRRLEEQGKISIQPGATDDSFV